jgi:hypothetical protein
MAFLTVPGSSILCVGRPFQFSCTKNHSNIFAHCREHIQRNEVYLSLFFNYAINIIFDQLHVPAALLPGKNHWIRDYMSPDDVASCILYVLLVSTYWHVFYCQLKFWMCWQNLTRFLNIHSGDKQWKACFLIFLFLKLFFILYYNQQMHNYKSI